MAYIDYRDRGANGPYYPGTDRQRYQDDPNARLIHTPGSARGNQGKFRPPTQPTSYAPETPQEEYDRRDAVVNARRDDTISKMQGMDAFQSRFGGVDLNDPRALGAALSAPGARTEWKRLLNVAKLGLPEDWNPDPNAGNWPVPRAPSGNYQYGPGRPGPTPPNVAQSAPPPGATRGGVRRGATPQTAPQGGTQNGMDFMRGTPNPMMEGYLGGGAGRVSGGQGGQFGSAGNRMEYGGGRNAVDTAYRPGRDGPAIDNGWWNQGGGYNPGQSKSGMGQSPYGNDMVSGNAYFGPDIRQSPAGMDAYNPYAQPQFNPYGNQGSIDPGFNVGPQQGSNMMGYGQNPYMPQGGGMQGGYMPFNGGNFSMPYDQYSGMGYW